MLMVLWRSALMEFALWQKKRHQRAWLKWEHRCLTQAHKIAQKANRAGY